MGLSLLEVDPPAVMSHLVEDQSCHVLLHAIAGYVASMTRSETNDLRWLLQGGADVDWLFQRVESGSSRVLWMPPGGFWAGRCWADEC